MKNIILLATILFIALFLRLHNLGKNNFWYDEAISILEDRGLNINDINKLPRLLTKDFYLKHGGYFFTGYDYSILYYWKRLFGNSEFSLRLPSVIFSLLTICAVYFLSKGVFGSGVSYLTTFLIAISPLSIYYSQEARQYSALSFFTVIAVWAFLKILQNNDRKHFFIYIIANVLNAYFHPLTIAALASFLIFFILNIKKYKYLLKTFIMAHIIILLLLLPFFLTIYYYLVLCSGKENFFPELIIRHKEIDLGRLLFLFKNLNVGYSIDYFTFIGKFNILVYFLLIIHGICNYYKKKEFQFLLYCIIISIFFMFSNPLYVDSRYFFSTFPFYILIAASGLSKINNRIFFIFVFLLIVFFSLFGLKNYYANYLPYNFMPHRGIHLKINTSKIARLISDNYRNGDTIIHTCKNTIFPLKFYITQSTSNPELIREINKGTVLFVSSHTGSENIYTYDYNNVYPAPLVSPKEYKIIKDLRKSERIWLIFSEWYFRGTENRREYKAVEFIKKDFVEYKLEKLEGAFVYLFVKK